MKTNIPCETDFIFRTLAKVLLQEIKLCVQLEKEICIDLC